MLDLPGRKGLSNGFQRTQAHILALDATHCHTGLANPGESPQCSQLQGLRKGERLRNNSTPGGSLRASVENRDSAAISAMGKRAGDGTPEPSPSPSPWAPPVVS